MPTSTARALGQTLRSSAGVLGPGQHDERAANCDFSGATATYYRRYRRSYPTLVLDKIRIVFGLDGAGHYLDLACGTGQLLAALAPHFATSTGIDREPDMLEQARDVLDAQGLSDVELLCCTAETIDRHSTKLRPLRLTTIGTAYHWLEPERVLPILYGLTEPNGGVAVLANGDQPWHHDIPWARKVKAVLEEYLGPLGEPKNFDSAAAQRCEREMKNSGFEHVEHFVHVYNDDVSREFIFGHIMSALSPGDIDPTRQIAFAMSLRSAIDDVAEAGPMDEPVSVRAVFGRRQG
jgi:SAM-dependent methyltransferase